MTHKTTRLIKAEDKKTRSMVDIEAYHWLEFSESSHVYADNTRKSVLFQEYHDPREIEQKVKFPSNFSGPLAPKSHPLYPVDLHEDFVISQREIMIRKRRRMMDEDEAIAQELAELVLPDEDMGGDVSWNQSPAEAEEPAQNNEEAETFSTQDMEVKETVASAPQERVADFVSRPMESVAVGVGMEQGFDVHAHAAAPHNEFKETATHQANSHQEGHFALGFDIGKTQGIESGKQEGFNQGLEEGIAQGKKETEEKTTKYFELLTQSIAEIDKLKNEVLHSGEQVFGELVKLSCEKILRTQVQLSNESLKSLFEKAVHHLSDRQHIKLEMNPQDADRILAMLETKPEIKDKVKMVRNENLPSGDFKAELDSEVIVVELKKAVDQFVNGLKDQLQTQKNDEDKKAG